MEGWYPDAPEGALKVGSTPAQQLEREVWCRFSAGGKRMVNMRMSDIVYLKNEARRAGPDSELAKAVGSQVCLADLFWRVR